MTSAAQNPDRKTVIFNALELVHSELHELAHEGRHEALIAEIREHLGHSYLADTNAPQGGAKWIACSERLPKGDEQYLCWQLLNGGVGSFESISGDYLRSYWKQLHITHWTIMPAPPAEARRVIAATGEKHE